LKWRCFIGPNKKEIDLVKEILERNEICFEKGKIFWGNQFWLEINHLMMRKRFKNSHRVFRNNPNCNLIENRRILRDFPKKRNSIGVFAFLILII